MFYFFPFDQLSDKTETMTWVEVKTFTVTPYFLPITINLHKNRKH